MMKNVLLSILSSLLYSLIMLQIVFFIFNINTKTFFYIIDAFVGNQILSGVVFVLIVCLFSLPIYKFLRKKYFFTIKTSKREIE